jgi:hypothetical protein
VKTVRFTKTVERRRHGAEQVFEEGQEYTLPDDLADHYTRRGHAVEVGGKVTEQQAPEGGTDGDPVGSSEDVGGADGADTGQRAKPVGKPAGSGKGGGKRRG